LIGILQEELGEDPGLGPTRIPPWLENDYGPP